MASAHENFSPVSLHGPLEDPDPALLSCAWEGADLYDAIPLPPGKLSIMTLERDKLLVNVDSLLQPGGLSRNYIRS